MLHPDNHNSVSNSYRNNIKSVVAFALLAIFSLPAMAQPFGPDGRSPELNLERMADRLDLSEQQRADIKAIMETGKTAFKPTVDAMQANREVLEELTNSNNPDPDLIQSLAETQGDLLTESLLHRASIQQQLNAILSEEQRIKMQAYKEAHRDMRTARKHHQPKHRAR
ncbi:MAG: Spy/CpxP family protein refolding chaperone [Proteobacteria bacterium]|nr:Spy/CpxP family protein refolding chaperone [Pseudomonadota bacterium]